MGNIKPVVLVVFLGLLVLLLIYFGKTRFETRANEFTDSLNTERSLAIIELSKQTTLPQDISFSQFSIIADRNLLPNFSQKFLIQNGDYMISFTNTNKIYIYRPTTKKLVTTVTLQ